MAVDSRDIATAMRGAWRALGPAAAGMGVLGVLESIQDREEVARTQELLGFEQIRSIRSNPDERFFPQWLT